MPTFPTLPRYNQADVLALGSSDISTGGTASVHLLQRHPAGIEGKFVYKEYNSDYQQTLGPEFIRVTNQLIHLLHESPNTDARRTFYATVNVPQAMVTTAHPDTGRLAITGMIFPHVPSRFLFKVGMRRQAGRLPQSCIVGKVPEEYQEQLGSILNRNEEISGTGAWGFLESLAFSIHVLHELRTFHGDLSASNIYFGGPTPRDARTRAYIIDAFNGFHRVGGRRFDLISTLRDPWMLPGSAEGQTHPHQIDIYQLCAWAAMLISERTYWQSHPGQGDEAELKDRARKAGGHILDHAASSATMLADDSGSRVLHEDTAKAIRAGLGPIGARPTATELYKLFHQEFVDARRRERAT